MNIRSKRRIYLGTIIVLLTLLLFMTNPDTLPLPMLTVPFILLFFGFYLCLQLLLEHIAPNLGQRKRKGLSLAVAVLPVLLLVLKSIGQLTPRDFFITVGLFTFLLFYFRKADFL